MRISKISILTLLACSSLFFSSCSKDDAEAVDPDLSAGGMNFGVISSAVVVVNPHINEGSTTTITPGDNRKDIALRIGELPVQTTDASGLAVFNDIPVGAQSHQFDNTSLNFEVENKGELYDLIVSYTGDAAYIVPVVRYPIGGEMSVLKPGDDLAAAASTDNAIILLEEGTYEGDVLVSGENVLIFGSWDPVEGPKSILEGNLTFNGGAGRIRGLQVNQTITVNANGFSAAFSNFNNADLKGNSMVLLRNTFTGEQVVVPSSSAVLVDNIGIQ
jgi:hypothetical protein